MKIRWTNLALAMGMGTITVSAVSAAPPQKKKAAPAMHHAAPAPKHAAKVHRTHRVHHVYHFHRVTKHVRTIPTGAETTLIGITLFDKGVQVLAEYGSPDTISPANVAQQINVGGAGGGPGGVGGAGFGGGGGRARGAPGGLARPVPSTGGGGGGGGGSSEKSINPGDDDFGNEMLGLGQVSIPPGGGQASRPGGYPGGPGMGPGGPGMGPGGPGMGRGGPGMGPGRGAFPGGAPGAGGGRGMGNSGGAAADNVVYTRWGYTHGPSRYSFVLDKYNRVVQIEAIGIGDSKVHTRRGIHFGSSFKSIIDTYGPPDGYDIAGDNSLTVRYLINAKVAFRLSRLGPLKPPVVTGIVIAAAKG